MKTNNKLSAYILRGSTGALLFVCLIIAVCSTINMAAHPRKATPLQVNTAFGVNAPQNRSLSFAERVAYQWAIDDVYWRHRIWPDTLAGPKPSLDAVMSQAQLEKKVEEYLRNSQALEDYWQRPITAEQLQAEMERMASNTKQPEVLQELFEALGNDPFVIAECLARPVLTQRLVADVLAQDKTGRFESLRTAELQMPREVAAIDSIAKAVQVNRPYQLPAIGSPSDGCIDDTWTATPLTNAPSARYRHTAVWTGSEMIVWGGYDGSTYFNSGGRYDPSTDSWSATNTTNAPEARYRHTAVWTGSEMIVWGGTDGTFYLNTGGRYNPSTDSWTATSTTNAPEARALQTAVWTGSEMIVWGGGDAVNYFETGSKYNPSTDSWTATSTTNAPEARYWHTAVWTGTEMIVWGGTNIGLNTGGRYNPITDSWTATSTTNAPAARFLHTAVWTGSEMIVWGGVGGDNTGGRYKPSTDGWDATSVRNAPSSRFDHTAVWTDNEMIVWGGNNGTTNLNSGGRYDAGTDSWTATSTTNAPEARNWHTAVWTGSEMIVWGGTNYITSFNTGGRYCAQFGSYPARRRHQLRPTPTPRP